MEKAAKPRGRLCTLCNEKRAALKRPKTLEQICRECFYAVFEDEIHKVIVDNQLFKPGERIAIGASGGKDSTVLAYVMSELNRRHNYGLDLFLLSVDEGITGYRDDSLETVKRNELQYGLPLKVVSYSELYGWTMDEIVKLIGLKNNCTFCGVFRRQALDRGSALLKVDKLVTGHNADDIAETVLLNILRGDIARLSRCTSIITGEDGPIPRCKPFKYTYEKEIVIYPFLGFIGLPLTISQGAACLLLPQLNLSFLIVITYDCLTLTCCLRTHTLKSWTTSLQSVSVFSFRQLSVLVLGLLVFFICCYYFRSLCSSSLLCVVCMLVHLILSFPPLQTKEAQVLLKRFLRESDSMNMS